MFALREAVLLCTIFFCLSSARAPKEGQRCVAEGRTGVCVVWNKCAPIVEMFQRYPAKQSEFIYTKKFKCGYKRHVPYYCCVDGMLAQPEAPPPQITEKPNPLHEGKKIKLTMNWAPREGDLCEVEGRRGVCVLWYNCEFIAAMWQGPDLQESQLIYAHKFSCGSRNRKPYFCCVDPKPALPLKTLDKPYSIDQITKLEQITVMNHPKRKRIPMETCGLTESRYIVGGKEATLGEFPWLALIHYKHKTRPGQFMYGGALINKHYVLTAAHCLHEDKLFGFYPDMVRLGEHDINSDPDFGPGGQKADPVIEFRIKQMIIHEDYNAAGPNQYHDIGLIRLNGEAPDTRYVSPICLPTPEVEKEIISFYDYLQVAGWGKTETGSRSSILLKIGIPTEDFENCARKYRSLGRNVTLTQLCAGMTGKDSCQGDSGGPLMGLGKYSNYTYLRFFAVGIDSYGHVKCGLNNFLGVYTRVSPYVGWILDHINR